MHDSPDLGLDTILAHYGEEEKILGAVVPPIFQNSLFLFETLEQLAQTISHTTPGPPYGYSRISNPTVDLVERKIAKLEKTDACKVFGSGMAALTAAAMSAVHAGSHVVILDTCYGPLRQLVGQYLAKFGVTHTMVDGSDPDEVISAFRPETTLVCLETPSSIAMRMQDYEPIAREARARGITTMIDNTYATPLFMNPAEFGIDLVVHSATKYLAGHSDLTAGAVCGSQERISALTQHEVSLIGSILAPLPAWLLNRGMRTLGVRMERAEKTGNTLASFLEHHPSVDRIHHLGLESYPQRELVAKYMRGTSSLFSIEPKSQDPAVIHTFCNALKIFGRGVSWGGHESLCVALPLDTIQGGHRWYIRFYCGLEDPNDLIRDIENAFSVSGL